MAPISAEEHCPVAAPSMTLFVKSLSAPSMCPWHTAAQHQAAEVQQLYTCQTACDLDEAAVNSGATMSPSPSSCVHQAWQLKRPVLQHDPKMTRRQLRKLGRTWTLSDVAQHKYCDDGWIAVDGKVYDITEHIATHPGWDSGCRVTEVLSIIAHLGCDCSSEFHEIHRSYPVAYKQLAAYFIGDLQP